MFLLDGDPDGNRSQRATRFGRRGQGVPAPNMMISVLFCNSVDTQHFCNCHSTPLSSIPCFVRVYTKRKADALGSFS